MVGGLCWSWWRSVVADQGRQGASCHVGFFGLSRVPRKEEGGPASRGSGRLAGGSGCCSSSMLGDRTELMLCDGHGGWLVGGGQLWVGSAPMYGTYLATY